MKGEDFGMVMSALRDCEDELRVRDLLDRLVGYAFRQSRTFLELEGEWAARIDARLSREIEEPVVAFPRLRARLLDEAPDGEQQNELEMVSLAESTRRSADEGDQNHDRAPSAMMRLEEHASSGDEAKETKTNTLLNLIAGGRLEGLIENWLGGEITPEEFAMVMSALRACDASEPRVTTVDQMITCAYRYSKTKVFGETEADWRARTKARLAPEGA